MPFYIRVETNGEASPESFAAMWDEVLESNGWHPGLTVLIDNRRLKPIADADAFTRAGIEYFAKNTVRFGKTCISTLSSQPDNFKYARQFQHGIRLQGSDVVLQVFNSEAKAVQWLDHYSHLPNKEMRMGQS